MHLLHALKLFIMDKLKEKKKTHNKKPEDLSQQIIILATILEKKKYRKNIKKNQFKSKSDPKF